MADKEKDKVEPVKEEVVLSDSAGGPVTLSAPLLVGIPVVMPLTDALRALGYGEKHLTEGVAVAAPLVEGIPEMHANAQANNLFEVPQKPQTIVAVHDKVLQEGTVEIEYIDTDGVKRSKKHFADAATMREFQKTMENTKADDTQEAMKKFFGNKERFNKDTLAV